MLLTREHVDYYSRPNKPKQHTGWRHSVYLCLLPPNQTPLQPVFHSCSNWEVTSCENAACDTLYQRCQAYLQLLSAPCVDLMEVRHLALWHAAQILCCTYQPSESLLFFAYRKSQCGSYVGLMNVDVFLLGNCPRFSLFARLSFWSGSKLSSIYWHIDLVQCILPVPPWCCLYNSFALSKFSQFALLQICVTIL